MLYKRKDPKTGKDYPNYWCKFEVAGKRHDFSTGTRNRRQAQAIEEERRTYYRSKAKSSTPQRGTTDLAYLAGLDVAECKANGASETRQRDALKEWERICEHFGATSHPRVITYDSVVEYIAARRAAGVRGQSIRRDIWAMKRGCTIAKRRGWLPNPPDEWPKVKSDPKKAEQAGKLHPPEVIRAWLNAMRPKSLPAYDEARFIQLTGLRAEETEKFTEAWIELAPDGIDALAFIHVPDWAAKSRDERWVAVVNPEVMEIIERRKAAAAAEDRKELFVGDFKKARDTARKAIGYDKRITRRDLRHFYMTVGLQKSGDAAATQAVAGHTDLRTTQKYQHSTLERAAAVARAVSEASGYSKMDTVPKSLKSKVKNRRKFKVFYGAKKGTRTLDLLITNHESAKHEHLNTCSCCDAAVTECMQKHGEEPRTGYSELIQPRTRTGGAAMSKPTVDEMLVDSSQAILDRYSSEEIAYYAKLVEGCNAEPGRGRLARCWRTPQRLFNALHEEFNFTLDAAADRFNSKLPRYNSAEEPDEFPWARERVFLNPPFELADKFTAKAAMRDAEIVVAILPSSVNSRWFHTHVLDTASEIRLPRKRIGFDPPPGLTVSSNSRDVILVVWRRGVEPLRVVPCDPETGRDV